MPQREFWTQQHPVGVRWQYDTDPRAADGGITLLCNVIDQSFGSIDSHSVRIRPNVVHEAVSDLLIGSWEAYLFGEPGDVRQTMKSRALVWQNEAASRPLWT